MYCHFPLYTVFSLISSLNFYINYSRAVLHIPSNPIPCIVFVLPYIPCSSTYTLYSLVSSVYSHISPYPSTYTPSYPSHRLCYLIYPLALLHIPFTPLYNNCTPVCPRLILHIHPRISRIVFVISYIHWPFCIYPLLPCIVLKKLI